MLMRREKKKTKQNKKTINEIIEKEREIQKLIYTLKGLKLRDIAIFNKKSNYLIEHGYYIEIARTLAVGLLS